jgi:hypothetical protein
MAEEDRPQDQPSLELPSFSLRRRRRDRPKRSDAAPPASTVAEPPAGPAAEVPAEPVAESTVEQPAEPAVEPVAEPGEHPTEAPPPVVEKPAERPAPARAAVREPVGRPAGVPRSARDATPASPEAAPSATAVHDHPDGAEEATPTHRPRLRQLPRPAGLLAATLTGLVTGLGLVGLTWAALRSCGAVRGTTSCGGAAGYPLVALIFVAMVVVAALLLRLARVPEPTGTSLLGLGLTGVVALLFLVDVLLDGSMVVVIPLLTAGTFALSYTVTTRVADPARD